MRRLPEQWWRTFIIPSADHAASPSYEKYDAAAQRPRLPREGWIDLTYRCNFRCRHCWVRESENGAPHPSEISFEEICKVADEARSMGCSHWMISGGEPLLRPDFADIFDYLTRKATSYTLNTNGSLITPAIARLLTRKGHKMIALYGADSAVHDHITRLPGSFEACMRGCAYLREAGAAFSMQIVPMRDSFHQLEAMYALARNLSPDFRIGASWLYLRADHDTLLNQEILHQRLPAEMINTIDPVIPESGCAGCQSEPWSRCKPSTPQRLFWGCIMKSEKFHIDPWGTMSFCSFIKDPAARFSLKEFSFQQIWDEHLPRLAAEITGTAEYDARCAICDQRDFCTWCGAYAWLETGRYSAPVEYLCDIARERKNYDRNWRIHHRRHYTIAGISLQVDSDLPMNEGSFDDRFKLFQTEAPGKDLVTIHHHYALPDLHFLEKAHLVYEKIPWRVYRLGSDWIYLGINSRAKKPKLWLIAIFNHDHTRAHIYHPNDNIICSTKMGSLTALPSDYVLLAQVLADRQAVLMHSAGLILNGQGLLFVGHSGAGKSTIVKLLRAYGQILCDDRVIVRKWPDGFHIHGTWSHGEIPEISNAEAPLKAIFFLHKAKWCSTEPVQDKRQIMKEFLFRTSRPLVTREWLEQTIPTLASLASQVPIYQLSFTKDERLLPVIEKFTGPLSREHAANAL